MTVPAVMYKLGIPKFIKGYFRLGSRRLSKDMAWLTVLIAMRKLRTPNLSRIILGLEAEGFPRI